MPERKPAILAVSFAAGILASEYIPALACALVSMTLCVILVATRKFSRMTLLLATAILLLGIARHQAGREIARNDVSRYVYRAQAFEGTVASDPEVRENRVRLIFRASNVKTTAGWQRVTGDVMVTVWCGSPSPQPSPARGEGDYLPEYGDRARISSYLYAPRGPTNPGSLDYRLYLARHGIYACASVRDPSDITMLPGNKGNPLVGAALAAKRYVTACIERIHPKEEASLIAGMVLGTYSYLTPETFRNFTRTGTLHLLAASGFNCYVLLLIATPLLSLAGIVPKYRNLVALCLVIMYLLMVGPKPSLVRASIVASLWLLSKPLKRAASLKVLFFIAAFIALMIKPSDLFDVGFQLSFLSVGGLIWAGPTIESALARFGLLENHAKSFPKRRGWVLGKLTALVLEAGVGSITITLVTAPVIAYYFNYVSLVSIPANMAMALEVPIVFADGIASALAAHVPLLGTLVGWIGTAVAKSMLYIVNYFGAFKYSAVSVASPGILAMLGYYLLLYSAVSYVGPKSAAKR